MSHFSTASRGLGIAVLLAGFFMSAGCRNGTKKEDEKPLDVKVSTPVEKEITDYEEFTGQIDAKETVKLQSKVDGFLEEVKFKEGDRVNEGQVLFVVDQKPYKVKLEQAKAAWKVGKAHKETMSATWERAVTLWEKKAISKEDYDKAVGDKAEAEANLDALKEAENSANLDLNYATIKAPFTGKISRRFVDPKNWVQGGTTVLSTIVREDDVYVYFNLDERTLLKIQRLVQEGLLKMENGLIKSAKGEDQKVLMGLGDEEDFPFVGTLNFMDNKLDPGTGTLLVRGVFNSHNGLLYPGLFCRVRLPIGPPHEALLISERALGTAQGEKFVFVVKEGKDEKDQPEFKVEYRKVKIGALHNGLRSVDLAVEKDGKIVGLYPGEKILVTGVQKVRSGGKVHPTLVPMPALATLEPQLNFGPKPAPAKKAPAK